MNHFSWIMIFVSAFSGSLVTTALFVRFFPGLAGLDVPNDRSLHSVVTPRGGGLALVLFFFLSCALFLPRSGAPAGWLGWAIGAALVAGLGWLDDHRSLSVKLRLSVQLLSAALLAIGLFRGEAMNPADRGDLGTAFAFVPMLVPPITVLFTVWLTNLYNFMDGIDGLAAAEAISVALPWGAFAVARGQPTLAGAAFALAGASAGFLVFNWNPAKIFMGDVASGFLGFCFAAMFLISDWIGAVPLAVSLILFGVFIVDTTYTLIVRALRRENVTQAHRDHAYQHACRSGWGHKGVARAALAINLAWLLPMALLAGYFPQWRWVILLVAYLPLIAVACRFRAGIEQP